MRKFESGQTISPKLVVMSKLRKPQEDFWIGWTTWCSLQAQIAQILITCQRQAENTRTAGKTFRSLVFVTLKDAHRESKINSADRSWINMTFHTGFKT